MSIVVAPTLTGAAVNVVPFELPTDCVQSSAWVAIAVFVTGSV